MVATDIKDTVNDLIHLCRDGQNGFEAAAKAVDDPSLKAELMQYSVQRQDFATDLKAALVALGEEPAEGGSVSASFHRGWINVKSLVTGSDRHAVLAECERGEDSAVAGYRDALQATLPPNLQTMVDSQADAVKRVHDRVKMLRDSSKK